MGTIHDIRVCACQNVMRQIGNGYTSCTNCDTVQDVERTMVNGRPGKRVTTLADRRFHLAWEARKREYYGAS